MKSTNLSRLKKWARNGAVLGLIVTLLDLTGWRGQKFLDWGTQDGALENIGMILGSVIGGAFLFLIAAVVVNLATRD